MNMNEPPQESPSSKVLPLAWIARLFERFRATWGTAVDGKYGSVDPAILAQEWAETLGVYTGEDLHAALRIAKEVYKDDPYPPSLPQFASLCRDAMRRRIMSEQPKRLGYDAPIVAAKDVDPRILAEIHKFSSAGRKRDPKDGARKLLQRYDEQDPTVNLYAVQQAYEALDLPLPADFGRHRARVERQRPTPAPPGTDSRLVCCHIDRGERCANLGRFSTSTQGTERYYCDQHFLSFGKRTTASDQPAGYTVIEAD